MRTHHHQHLTSSGGRLVKMLFLTGAAQLVLASNALAATPGSALVARGPPSSEGEGLGDDARVLEAASDGLKNDAAFLSELLRRAEVSSGSGRSTTSTSKMTTRTEALKDVFSRAGENLRNDAAFVADVIRRCGS
ncbi:unnamed protein product, partial [Amoebophrya sp. A25]|eukprot:GSA25T00024463001.1